MANSVHHIHIYKQDRQYTCKSNTEARSCNCCCCGKAINIAYCVCMCIAQLCSMQCACAILSSVACPVLQYFSTCLINRIFFEKKLLNAKRAFWYPLHLLSETCLILRRIERDMIKMYISLHVKYRYSCSSLMKLEFFQQFFEKYSNIEFHKNAPIGSCVVQWELCYSVRAVLFSDSSAVQWELCCSVRAVLFSESSAVQWEQCCSVGAVLFSKSCAVQWEQCCSVRAVLFSESSAVQWELCCSVEAVLFSGSCAVQ